MLKKTMKRLFLVLASMASVASTFAQDVIVKRDGEEIQCKILEVSTNKVKYKQWKNQDGPTFVEKKTDVLMLKYENGQKEVISYSGPVSASQVEEVAIAPVDSAALRDTMPISNDFLEYVRKEKSGLLMWGRSISEEKAHEVMGKDWTDFSRAHRGERAGRAMIFTGSALIVGGGVFTALHVKATNDYNDKKSAYEDHIAQSNADFAAKVNGLNNAYLAADANKAAAKSALDRAQFDFDAAQIAYDQAVKKNTQGDMSPNEWEAAKNTYNAAKNAFESAEADYNSADEAVTSAFNAYKTYYVDNGTENYNLEFYKPSFKDKMDDAEHFKKATFAPMISCYASGAALLIWGLIKESRAHTKVKRIVNTHNAEEVYPAEIPAETSFKPQFDIEGRENGLAFLLKF